MIKKGLHQLKSSQLNYEKERCLNEDADASMSKPALRSKLLCMVFVPQCVCECGVS